ncbi:heparan-alpha-glucosaminide N-acetyltransferase domain-containing protein [Aeromicrobium chenweiae]|uniref:Uncharacterized protein n=1 Tax=Aeromicrobium chenweiae TaxID=2079793 RepID=A0A2S0WKA0_9ACTN|nr:heparan-alpha-glucosaminide N-acetyltransferase domain-containing protein [Aeromicrobium chenweiae]AWB91765.1 hypothetical protein C3E78_05840 [Aeromicrobium chenweiae]TGN32607.1 DUF1624 domain-containing protein [Aeromicrobium chenweiae]
MAVAADTPVRAPSRVEAVDVARGVALIGMMLAHLGPVWLGADPPVGHMIAGGRAAPLFAMLAGVSLTLVQRRDPEGVGSVRATIVRGILLVALGLSLGAIEDMPVLIILAFYGLMIVVALPFRGLPTPWLALLAVVWTLASGFVVVALQVLHGPVDAGQAEAEDLEHPFSLLQELTVLGAYPALAWFSYVLVGLLVGRLDVRRPVVACRLVGLGTALVVVTLGAGWLLVREGAVEDPSGFGWRSLFTGRYGPTEWNDLLRLGQHTSTPLNLVSATGSALLAIGLCALAVRVPWLRLALTPLRAAGTMTLTLYTVHALWFWRLASAHDDALGPRRGGYDDWLLQVVVLCAVAVAWQRWVGRGPLESLVRVVSVPPTLSARKNAPARDRGVDSSG